MIQKVINQIALNVSISSLALYINKKSKIQIVKSKMTNIRYISKGLFRIKE